MKRKWTRGEKMLWATPLIFLVSAGATMFGPQVARRQLGLPVVLDATPAKSSSLRSIELSIDGALLVASCSESSDPKINGGKILFWDARTLKPTMPRSPGGNDLNNGLVQRTDNFAFVLARDGKSVGFYRLVLGRNRKNHPFGLYDIATGKPQWELNGTNAVEAAHFSPDGQTIGITRYANKHDMEIVILRATDGTVVHRWIVPQVWTDTTNFAWSPDGETIVTVGTFPAPLDKYGRQIEERYRFEVRRADTGKIVRFWPTRQVQNFDLAPNGRSLVAVTSEKEAGANVNFRATVVDITTGRELWQFGENETENRPLAAKFASNGKTIAVHLARMRDSVGILNAQTGIIKRTLSTGGETMNYFSNSTALAWSPDSKRLYARGQNAVLVWDLD